MISDSIKNHDNYHIDHETKQILEVMGIDVDLLLSKPVHGRKDTLRILGAKDHNYLNKYHRKGWLPRYINKERHFYASRDILKFLKKQSPNLQIVITE